MAPPNVNGAAAAAAAATTMNYALVSGAVVDVGEADDGQQAKQRSNVLAAIFDDYAQQYPNPRLVQECEQRDALLQQVAAQQAVSETPPPLKKKKGLLSFFRKRARHTLEDDGRYDISHLKDDEWLEYYTEKDETTTASSTVLLDSTLDVECIPQEAYSMARFHLSCRNDVPNVARSHGTTCIVTLVNLGVICEIYKNGETALMETSDLQALQEYIGGTVHDVSRARAVFLRDDELLAVSWGLPDGIVVLYERHPHSWDSIAVLSPTRAVIDNVKSNNGHTNNSMQLLVTDLVTMTVQDPHDANGVVTTLAVSRLGGYIEFIIVPHPLHKKHPTKKRRRSTEHYAADLHNLSFSNTGMTALTTADYHVDILCLEAYRTKVGSDTEWDTDAFPKTPPAEYVLAASGGTKDGQQVISFWGVSVVFAEMTEGPNAPIHVTILDAIHLGAVGADVTVFVSETMWKHWRKPRRVRLRASESADENREEHETKEPENNHNADMISSAVMDVIPESKAGLLSTLSTSMPIVRMRLASRDFEPQALLAALDGNGGLTFVDCTGVISLAAHDLAQDELEDESLLKVSCKLPSKSLPSTADIGWLRAPENPSEATDKMNGERDDSPSFALVVAKSRKLQVVSLGPSPHVNDPGRMARVSYSLDIPSMSRGATVIASSPGQCISLVTIKILENRRKLLCHANLERLDSSTVIVMLVKASKYAEAIEAAKAMDVPSCSDAIQLCHKRLWEQNGEVVHLSAVIDDDYVVTETLSIFNGDHSRTGIDLGTARAACLLALERMKSAQFVSPGVREEKFRDLEAIEAKVSTYILLCRCNDAVPQLRQFLEKFLLMSIRWLAAAFASKGDTTALTTILFRHRPDLLQHQLEILDKLPLELQPDKFAHLLPVSPADKNCFHTGEHGDDGRRQWSLMAHYMESTYGVRLLLDDKDEAVILDRCRLFDNRENILQASSVKRWFLARAKRIQHEIGSISLLRDFLDLASQRLDVSFTARPGEDMDPELQELNCMYAYAIQLDRILADKSFALTAGKLAANALASMSLSDVEKMRIEDRVLFILGPPNDPSAVLSKLRNGFTFLTLGGGKGSEQNENVIDSSISAYCGNAIVNSVSDNGESGSRGLHQADALRNALDVCTEIANASRTTIQRSNRVVKDKGVLMNIVLTAAYDTSRASKLIDLSPSDCRHMVDSIWESYECLPTRFSPDDASQNAVQTKVDGLYHNLVIIDIFSRWSPAALKVLVDLNATESERANVGLTVINEMCRSFCHQLSRFEGAVAVDLELNLLKDLISDIDQLKKVGFDSTFPMASTLQESLIKPLLQQEEFHLIDTLVKWINRDEVKAAVLAFVNEAMFDDGESLSPVKGMVSSERVQAAINCQDCLGPLFPELRAKFESSRRYLDAAFFINRMAGSNKFMYPCEVRDKLPLDIIESAMTQNPGCIFDGCRDWVDRDFSRKANEAICGHYWSMRQGNVNDSSSSRSAALPVLPGSAIYHLALLLGLEGPHALLVVKARVVYHAILVSEFAAAAAVCATMVYENGPSWNEPAVAQCIVNSVARVVSLNDYDDVKMRLALCSAVFERDRDNLLVHDYKAYETVLDAFVALENSTHRHQQPQETAVYSPGSITNTSNAPESGMEAPARSDFLVFRAAGIVAKTAKYVARHAQHPLNQQLPHGARLPSIDFSRPPSLSDRVYHDILVQYSTDVHHLFWILRGVSASSSVDDPLLLTIGRLIVFWCISDALRMRPQTVPLEPERADLEDVLAMGLSLLLHAQDREALVSCIGELQGILARETVAAMERAASEAQPDNMLPDPEIVRTLISRGYSENGARRAAAMTGNESAQVALVWAVSHTLDDGFDDPMVTVASPDGLPSVSRRVDQCMVNSLQEALNLVSSYISRKHTLQSLLPGRQPSPKTIKGTQMRSTSSKGTQQNGNGQKVNLVGDEKEVALATSLPSKPATHQVAKPPFDRIHKAAATPSGMREKTKVQPIITSAGLLSATKPSSHLKPTAILQSHKRSVEPLATKHRLVVPEVRQAQSPAVESSSSAAREVAPRPMAAPSIGKPIRNTSIVDSVTVNRKSPVPPPAPPPSVPKEQGPAPRSLSSDPKLTSAPSGSVDRLSTLRSNDERNKSAAANLASDERQRLIAEGRRMLQQARASRASTMTKVARLKAEDTSATASTRAGRYPLRSRMTASVKTTDRLNVDAGSNAARATRSETGSPAPPSESAKQEENDDDGWDFDDF